MSSWTYIRGTIHVRPFGRTQAEKTYILQTVIDHLPRVTGSEGDMDVYTIKKNGTSSSCSVDEFGMTTNLLTDRYGDRSRDGWLRTQDEYILVVDASLRDRCFDETFKEFQNWLCRLAKRIEVFDVFVEIKSCERSCIIQDKNLAYLKMFESPSWCNDNGDPNWCEYLMWKPMDSSWFPRVLGYKYYNDADNDRKVKDWIRK